MNDGEVILDKVGKEFVTKRQKIVALKDISMEFHKGEFVSIVGPSGCGKSTIIRMIDDIIKPTSGSITVDGIKYNNESSISKDIVKKLGFIFQLPNLFPWLTIKENVMFPLKILGIKGKEFDEYADYLLSVINMTDYADAYPKDISGGMAQRVGVIRAMIHKPKILMMDEPFGALDDKTRQNLNIELLKIWKDIKMTVIFITHNVEEAVLLGQKVYIMGANPGRVTNKMDIDFEDERTLDLIETSRFNYYKDRIVRLIGDVDISNIK